MWKWNGAETLYCGHSLPLVLPKQLATRKNKSFKRQMSGTYPAGGLCNIPFREGDAFDLVSKPWSWQSNISGSTDQPINQRPYLSRQHFLGFPCSRWMPAQDWHTKIWKSKPRLQSDNPFPNGLANLESSQHVTNISWPTFRTVSTCLVCLPKKHFF